MERSEFVRESLDTETEFRCPDYNSSMEAPVTGTIDVEGSTIGSASMSSQGQRPEAVREDQGRMRMFAFKMKLLTLADVE